jgi:hypothetical protein
MEHRHLLVVLLQLTLAVAVQVLMAPLDLLLRVVRVARVVVGLDLIMELEPTELLI